MSEQDRERIINFGAFEYDAETCAIILGWDIEEVEKAMGDENTEFMKLYRIGQVKAQYVIDLKLFEQAQAGDLKSLDKLEFRKKKRKK